MRLFERYNHRFWSGRLEGWTVTGRESFAGTYGKCDPSRPVILVNLSTHDSDFGVRATVVHEMGAADKAVNLAR
jgi:hypothetical protein